MADKTLSLDKFLPNAQLLVSKAQKSADSGACPETTVAHLALELLRDADVLACAKHAGWDPDALRSTLVPPRQGTSKEPAYLSEDLLTLLAQLERSHAKVTVRDMFFALVDVDVLPPTRPESWPEAAAPAPKASDPTSAVRPFFRLAADVAHALAPASQAHAHRALLRCQRDLEAAIVPQLDIETLPPNGLRFGRPGVDDWIAALPDEQGLRLMIYKGGDLPTLRRFVPGETSLIFVEAATGANFSEALCDTIRDTLYPEVSARKD